MIRLILLITFVLLLAYLVSQIFKRPSKLQQKVAQVQDELEDARQTKTLLQQLEDLKKQKAKEDEEIVELTGKDLKDA